MGIKLTKEIVNERIKPRGITMTGEYTNAHTITQFRCQQSHEWSAKPSNILDGKGCPHCADTRLTKEIVNERIKPRGITMTGEYQGSQTKTTFVCSGGDEWVATPSMVLRGGGCPHCADTRLTKEIVNERIKPRGITMTGEYLSALTKAEFQCEEGHLWITTPNSVMAGRGCPQCAKSGFNSTNEAWEYVLDFGDFLKYGITNDLPRRLNEHKKNGPYTLVHERHHKVGKEAMAWEKNIKQTHGGRYATKEQCPDGYTETLPISKLKDIINYKHQGSKT